MQQPYSTLKVLTQEIMSNQNYSHISDVDYLFDKTRKAHF